MAGASILAGEQSDAVLSQLIERYRKPLILMGNGALLVPSFSASEGKRLNFTLFIDPPCTSGFVNPPPV